MLSQNPRGPSGHAPGSLRISRKPARPRKISGQWRAQRARPVAYRIARSPIARTNSPATLWLNSDHARSAAVRGASRSSTGISVITGDESVGHRGVNRVPTSASVARSAATSTAGGSEVSDAATKRAVTPSPTSTSTNRRRRAGPTSDAAGSRRTARKFIPPRVRSPARIPTLVRTIMPYDVPSSAWTPPTYESVSASPATTRTATAVSASAEKRLSRSAGQACTPRPSAVRTRWPRPPIHAAAATWCSPSSVSRRPRGRVARPRRAHRERERPPEKRDPSKPGARRTADAETTDDEPDAGEDAGGGGADVRRGDKLADGPAAATHQGAKLDGKREELRPAKDRRARRGGREAPAERRRQRRARAHRGA